LAEARPALLQFPLPHNALPLNSKLNGTLDGQVIGLLRCTRALVVFDLALQFGDSPARLIEASDFLFHLMRQVGKLGQHSANRARWRRRREKMTLAGARMCGADLFRAEMHDSGLALQSYSAQIINCRRANKRAALSKSSSEISGPTQIFSAALTGQDRPAAEHIDHLEGLFDLVLLVAQFPMMGWTQPRILATNIVATRHLQP
jgi:hypothetical protein